MSPVDEVAPGLWRFTVTRNGLPPTMTAYVLRDGEDTILVDPLVAGETEQLLAALDEIVRGRVRILVTTPFHVRGSGLLWRRWRDRYEVTIFGHEYCAARPTAAAVGDVSLTATPAASTRRNGSPVYPTTTT